MSRLLSFYSRVVLSMVETFTNSRGKELARSPPGPILPAFKSHSRDFSSRLSIIPRHSSAREISVIGDITAYSKLCFDLHWNVRFKKKKNQSPSHLYSKLSWITSVVDTCRVERSMLPPRRLATIYTHVTGKVELVRERYRYAAANHRL